VFNKIIKVLFVAIVSAAVIVLTIMLVRAFDARKLADPEVWHRVDLQEEFHAGASEPLADFPAYLELEGRLFEEMDRCVCLEPAPEGQIRLNRYVRGSPSSPGHFPRDWNRSFELGVDRPRGGVLLLHGLTDSPYSVRAAAEAFHRRGYYVLAPRLPGHGTTPSSLATATWRDWVPIVRVAAEHVRSVVGPDGEFLLGGYSNGGALAIHHTLDALAGDGAELPDRLYLFSPAVGVTRFAKLASWHKLLAWIPYFEKFRWSSIRPEYDPFKYNSFPKAAGYQTHALTKAVQARLREMNARGLLDGMPPILAFQSLVDSTVLTESIVDHLFDELPANGSELVVFDYNRLQGLRGFLRAQHAAMLRRLTSGPPLAYTVTLITNRDDASREVVARRRRPAEDLEVGVPLDLSWPQGVYSLSHVAIPFPPEDSLYGDGSGPPPPGGLPLGRLQPRGEKRLLTVPVDQFMRLRYNPFFAYVEQRLAESVEAGGDPPLR
jgi:alpha-beta hydrolase superfamily lysophospholipase